MTGHVDHGRSIFNNMKRKKSIQNKIIALLLSSVLTALFISSTLALLNINSMKKSFDNQSEKFEQSTTSYVEDEMIEKTCNQLLILSDSNAAAIDKRFENINRNVDGIVNLAEHIYCNPNIYPDREVDLPQKNNRNLSTQLLWSKSISDNTTDSLTGPLYTVKISNLANIQDLLYETIYTEEILKLANIQDLLYEINYSNDMISSVYIATESGWMIQADYISKNKYSGKKILPDNYEASERPWFINAKNSKPGEIVHTEVFQDIHSKSDCIVCSKAVYKGNVFVGVVGVGSYLDEIYQEVDKTKAVLKNNYSNTGYAFLVDENGKIVVSGATSGETAVIGETNPDLKRSGNSDLRTLAESMQKKESKCTKIKINDKEVFIAYAPLDTLGWSFATVVDAEEILMPANESKERINTLNSDFNKSVGDSQQVIIIEFIIVTIVLFIVFGFLSIKLGKRISEPVQKLTAEVVGTNGKNLDGLIEFDTNDELEDLANAFNNMRLQIKEYIENIKIITKEKERIHTELLVATNIQNDMLPDSSSMLNSSEEFSIYAVAYPAKEVGGDFYDFFFIDQDHLAFIVADVSGKSVPAGLFMVMAKTLIENQLMLGKNPAETFEDVNSALCRNNRNGMFLTAWLGFLELSTGKLDYVNAGHNCPLLYEAESNTYSWLTGVSGFVLAGMEDMTYEQKHMVLKKGDKIFVYSDGVPEANDIKGDMYGNAALELFFSRNSSLNPDSFCGQLKTSLEQFQGEAEQFDDITMLFLEYNGAKNERMVRCSKPRYTGKNTNLTKKIEP